MLWAFGRCGFQDASLKAVMGDVAEKLAQSCDRCLGWGGRGDGINPSDPGTSTATICTPPHQPTNPSTRPRPRPPRSTSLADVVYAEAQMGWADQRLAELVADYAASNIGSFDAASLTRLLAGLASVGYDDDSLAEAAGTHACALLESGDMTPSQLVGAGRLGLVI
jgi:hypothetical protein